jgi:signal peptidase I
VVVLVTLVLATMVRIFLVAPFYIPSSSMEDTLHVGDRVLVDRIGYHLHPIRRGDVVVFNGLDSWTAQPRHTGENIAVRALRGLGAALGLAPTHGTDFVKRVIGLPGDEVRCCDAQGRMTVNGDPLDERSYLYRGDRPSDAPFDVIVPDGRLWVMGDHRHVSVDSRSHLGDPGGGTVPEDQVVGRVFSVIWPLGHISGLGRPDTFGRLHRAGPANGGLAPYALGLGLASPSVMSRSRSRYHGDKGRTR